MRMKGGEDGYTLLEVLVAFVILSGAVIMSFKIFGEGLGRLNKAEDQVRMVGVAQGLLAELQLKPALEPGTLAGVAGGYAWSVTLARETERSDKPEAPGTVTLFRARIEVRPEGKAEAAAYRLETRLLAASP